MRHGNKQGNHTQEHALICPNLRNLLTQEQVLSLSSVSYSDLFSDTGKQYKITQVFDFIIQTREKMRAPPSAPAYPGYNTGPADD